MSDFDLRRYNNQNLGNYVLMGGMAMYAQRSRQIDQLNQQHTEHMQELHELKALQRASQQTEQRSQQTEQRRLETEQQRLRLEENAQRVEQERRALQDEQAKHQKEIRNFLADTIAMLEDVQRSNSADTHAVVLLAEARSAPACNDLTVALATVQARVIILDRLSDALTDLSDMQAYRRLKMDLKSAISTKAISGDIPDEPLCIVTKQIDAVVELLSEIDEIYKDYLRIKEQLIKGRQKHSLTVEVLQSLSAEIIQHDTTIPAKLDEFKHRLLKAQPKVWESNNAISLIRSVVHPDSPVNSTRERDLYLFVQKRDYYKRGSQVRDLCQKLIEVHEQELAEASALANQGDFIQARSAINRLKRVFRDLDYDAVLKQCDEWNQPFKQLDAEFWKLQTELIAPSPLHYSFVKQIRESFNSERIYKAKAEKIATFRQMLERFVEDTAQYPPSDFTKEATKVACSLRERLVHLQGEIEVKGKRQKFFGARK